MRKVLITGATSGFGKLLVDAFLKNGDLVLASGRSLTNRPEVLKAYRDEYPKSLVEYDLDVTDKIQVAALIKELNEKYEAIDILINNAGYGLFGSLEDLTEEEIRYQMEVNFFGTLNVTKAVLPLLRKAQGKIFNFSSVFGFMGFPLTSIYCASKFAVEGMTESLRGELAPHGVQVCLIEPGGYRTNFGENIAWAKAASDSVYRLQSDNYQALRIKISNRKNGQDPIEVARGVLKLSKSKKLPMRKVYGKDGKASYVLKNFIPDCWYWTIMDTAFRKLFLKKLN